MTDLAPPWLSPTHTEPRLRALAAAATGPTSVVQTVAAWVAEVRTARWPDPTPVDVRPAWEVAFEVARELHPDALATLLRLAGQNARVSDRMIAALLANPALTTPEHIERLAEWSIPTTGAWGEQFDDISVRDPHAAPHDQVQGPLRHRHLLADGLLARGLVAPSALDAMLDTIDTLLAAPSNPDGAQSSTRLQHLSALVARRARTEADLLRLLPAVDRGWPGEHLLRAPLAGTAIVEAFLARPRRLHSPPALAALTERPDLTDAHWRRLLPIMRESLMGTTAPDVPLPFSANDWRTGRGSAAPVLRALVRLPLDDTLGIWVQLAQEAPSAALAALERAPQVAADPRLRPQIAQMLAILDRDERLRLMRLTRETPATDTSLRSTSR